MTLKAVESRAADEPGSGNVPVFMSASIVQPKSNTALWLRESASVLSPSRLTADWLATWAVNPCLPSNGPDAVQNEPSIWLPNYKYRAPLKPSKVRPNYLENHPHPA